MSEKSSKKVEKQACTKIEDLIGRMEYVDYKFNVDDTGISWDGSIDLYHGNIDKKKNFDCSIKVQIKGRTVNIKRLPDKKKFDVDKSDLENYLKEDGTMFLLVLFKDIDNFKIYAASLLPYDLRNYLKEQTNPKNEIKIQLKEVKGYRDFETILRNFSINEQEQKKISKNVFQQGELSIKDDSNNFKFYDWRNTSINVTDLLGEEKYLYQYDELNNITNITCAKIYAITECLKINITNQSGKIFYSTVNRTVTKEGNKLLFGGVFELEYKKGLFNFIIQGTLQERIKQLEFLKYVLEENGFKLNNQFISLNSSDEIKEMCERKRKIYAKINDFLIKHKIKKDLDFDSWTIKDINELLLWILALDDNKPLKIKEFEISTICSIKIKDLRFSVYADKREDGGFDIYSIWNSNLMGKYIFTYKNGDMNINTKNLYSILNKNVYLSDDINFEQMKEKIDNYSLVPREEELFNLQALEVIKAYDCVKSEELLDYALYLLNKIEKYKEMSDTIFINKMQIFKRKNIITTEMKFKLVDIKDKTNNTILKICVDLLIDSNEEAKILYLKLNSNEKLLFKEFPISIYL